MVFSLTQPRLKSFWECMKVSELIFWVVELSRL